MAGRLGGFLGPLAYAGEPPITGWLKGLVEGEERQRKFAREDQEAQLRALQLIREGAPQGVFHGNQFFRIDPRTGQLVGAPTTLPSDPLSDARTREANALADLHTKQAEGFGQQVPAEHARLFREWMTTHPGGNYLDFYKEIVKPPKESAVHVVTDEKGNVTLVAPRRGAGGALEAETKDLGHIGKQTPKPDEATVQYLAEIFANTGAMPALGMASNSRFDIYKRAGEITNSRPGGVSASVLRWATLNADKTELNQLQAQRGKIMAFSITAERNLDLVAQLSERTDRTGSPLLNKWMLAGRRTVLGDVEVSNYHLAMETAIREFARVTSSATGAGGVLSDASREAIDSILNTSMTKTQIVGAIKTARIDLLNRRQGYDDQIQAIRSNIRALGEEPSGAAKEDPAPPGLKWIEPAAPAPAPPAAALPQPATAAAAAAPAQGTLGTAPPSSRSPALQGSPLVTPPGAAAPATVPGRLGTSPLSPNQVAALRARGYTNVTTVEQARNLGVPIPPPETPGGLRQRSTLMTPPAAAPAAPGVPGRLGTPGPPSSRSTLLQQRSGLVTPPPAAPAPPTVPSRVTPPPSGKLPEDIIPAPTQKEKEDFRKAWPKGHPEAAPGSIESQRRATEALSPKDREFAPAPLTPPSRRPVVPAPTPDEIERYAFHQWASDNNLDAATPKAKQRWESLSVLDKGRYYQRVTQELLRSRREQMERR